VERIKPYVYVSDAKIEMLLGMIDRGALESLQAELQLGATWLHLTVTTSLKGRSKEQTVHGKVSVVRKWLETQYGVGGVLDDTQYFSGALITRWGTGTGGMKVMQTSPFSQDGQMKEHSSVSAALHTTCGGRLTRTVIRSTQTRVFSS
jgi:hypothetical protein